MTNKDFAKIGTGFFIIATLIFMWLFSLLISEPISVKLVIAAMIQSTVTILMSAMILWFQDYNSLVFDDEDYNDFGEIYGEEFEPIGEVINPSVEIEEPQIRDICDPKNNPYIRKGYEPEKILVAGKESRIYPFEAIKFDLTKVPHFLIVGESGGGKSVTTYNILTLLNKQYDFPKIAIVDMGYQDFSNAIGNTFDEFLYVLDLFYLIIKGRQMEGPKKNRQRLIFLVEEFEAVLAGLKLLPKTKRDQVLRKLGDIARMARKLNVNMVFIVQSGKASDFDSGIRNNFGNQLVHRGPTNLTGMFNCPFNITDLEVGQVYYSKIAGFIKMGLIDEPQMNLMTETELSIMAKSYVAKFPQIEEKDE